jgi:5-methylcytosine-specific restriction endonuclease McrA
MTRRYSNAYAPEGTCPRCGWTGRDWGFKYRNLCKRCHKQWRKKKVEEQREYNSPNTNVKIANGIVVTEHVHKRLCRRAEREVGATPTYWLARIIPFVIVIGTMYVIDIVKQNPSSDATVFAIMFAGLFLAAASYCIFAFAWEGKVARKTTELAYVRQRDLEEQQRFYNSPEWGLLREQVLSERGRRCEKCGQDIRSDFDLTVDHVKPRSKFPELALDKSNLQVLCRRCNSSKGATYDESSMPLETTAEVPSASAERV